MTTTRTILVVGAGIAGLTLAYWLQQYGFEPVIVERRPDLHDEGYMIDFYGSGFDVAEKMGLREALHGRHYPIPRLVFVDERGAARAALDIEQFRRLLNYRHFNFMRGDLAAELHQAARQTVPIRFGTTLAQIDAQPDGVEVAFSDGTHGVYDLLIGADGVHSQVRGELWGDERQFERFLGYYVACAIADADLGEADAFYSHVEPKTQASVYALRGNRLATFFAFKSERLDVRGREAQQAALETAFGRQGWRVPQLLAATQRSADFYFDAVTQIRLTPWYQGRVALVGDACQCLTLLAGQGASLAMAGAYVLAGELHQAQGDYRRAFPTYQARLAPEITRRQAEAEKLASSFVPGSRTAIGGLYLFMKLAFLPPFRWLFLRQIGARSIIH